MRGTVVCVLRSGGDFSPEWVGALHRGLKQVSPDSELYCFTDRYDEVVEIPDVIPLLLVRDHPGWWAKFEVFRPGLLPNKPVLYVDLDTLFVGDPAPLLEFSGEFSLLSDFYFLSKPQTGLMAWTPNSSTDKIWEVWDRTGQSLRKKFVSQAKALAEIAPWTGKLPRLQTLFPNRIVSFKQHARQGIPPGALIVAGHGQPRFSDPQAGWAHLQWKG